MSFYFNEHRQKSWSDNVFICMCIRYCHSVLSSSSLLWIFSILLGTKTSDITGLRLHITGAQTRQKPAWFCTTLYSISRDSSQTLFFISLPWFLSWLLGTALMLTVFVRSGEMLSLQPFFSRRNLLQSVGQIKSAGDGTELGPRPLQMP